MIERWMRKQSELTMHWDRRQFKHLERISTQFRPLKRSDGQPMMKLNKVTQEMEPYYPRIRRNVKICISILFTIFMMLCLLRKLRNVYPWLYFFVFYIILNACVFIIQGIVFAVHVTVLRLEKSNDSVKLQYTLSIMSAVIIQVTK